MEDIKHIKRVQLKNNIYYPHYDNNTKSLCIPIIAGQTVHYLEIPRSVILELLKDGYGNDDWIIIDDNFVEDTEE